MKSLNHSEIIDTVECKRANKLVKHMLRKDIKDKVFSRVGEFIIYVTFTEIKYKRYKKKKAKKQK